MNMFQKRVDELSAEIKEAAQKYYTDGTSSLTDAEFDAKVDELRELDPEAPVVNSTGWGYSVEEDTMAGEKVNHKYIRVGSLDKVRTWKEFAARMKTSCVAASLKLDGISVVLYYAGGWLYQALTRGDGATGIDITAKVRVIAPHMVQLGNDFNGAVRGEILMKLSDFAEFQKRHPEAKNARNSTAGLIGSNDITDDLMYLSIVVYTVVGDDDHILMGGTMNTVIGWLQQYFGAANVAPYNLFSGCAENTFEDKMYQYKHMWYNDYPADGIVLTDLLLSFNDTNGVKYTAVAFKFPSEIKESTVEQVEWNLSKSRYAIPKVRIKPIELAGTTVSYCTGFNAQFIRDNNIGVGTVVKVEKRGEIIPNIVEVVKGTAAELPSVCPECGTPLEWSGVQLKCPNEICNNAARQDLSIWLETLAPVEGLKDSLKFRFLEAWYGDDLSIETVMSHRSEWTTLGGRTGHKELFNTMLRTLADLTDNSVPIATAFQALNIPRFGGITCKKLAGEYLYVKSLVDLILFPERVSDADHSKSSIYEYLATAIGTANAAALRENENKLKRLSFIYDAIQWEPPIDICRGKVAITGALSVKRTYFEGELAVAGYKVGEISKDTDFLITNTPDSTSSKNQKADQWGITKITEADFRAKYM